MVMKQNNAHFLQLIKNNVESKITFNSWFKDLYIIKEEKNKIYICVKNDFIKKLLSLTHYDFLQSLAAEIYGEDVVLVFLRIDSPEYHKVLNNEETKITIKEAPLSTNNLNPKYNFEDFIVGENNRFSHAACLAAAEKPAQVYNPLFIYGGVGLGKTHLMHATGHHFLKNNPKAKILYVSTETFTNEMINALGKGSLSKFREKYRNIDLLLIDDIQFLENKGKTQEEFFYTFNALKDSNRQIVISSDDPPNKLKIEERLISRFAWGLTTDIGRPDFETRVAILQKKADTDNIKLPLEVYNLIAQKITSNIRELEGALIRVDAFLSLNSILDQQIDEELINSILKDITNNDILLKINEENIKKAVSSFYGIKVTDLDSRRRSRNISFPRQIAMFLIRDLTELSLPKIGQFFGGKDHTTVMHACDKISILMETDPEVKQVVNQIIESLETGKF